MNQFLSPDPTRIGRPDVPPCSDAVDEKLAGGTPDELKTDLTGILGEDLVRHRITDLVRYASDASPYRYVPNVVVQPRNIDHVAAIFRYCLRQGRHATFRAGGTSLNGQSQGDDLLIEYDNTTAEGNHAHTVLRRPGADFGADILAAHRRQEH